jgi:outer membrane protein OmpA-like peptidoglycan-associated protein
MKYTLALFACPAWLSAQVNLVLNPSFELTKPDAVVVPCEFSQYPHDFPRRIDAWSSFRDGTPDLLQAAENCDWLQQAHSGTQCLGIITYLPAADVGQKSDFHEFVQGQLSAPLKPGQRYRLEFWALEDPAIARAHLAKVYGAKAPLAPLQAGNLGFLFTVAPFGERDISTAGVAVSRFRPQVNFPEPIRTGGKWAKYSAEWVPDQPFQYFTMGNFFSDKTTPNSESATWHEEIEQKNKGKAAPLDRVKRVAYLCVDDVSVTAVSLPATPVSMEKALLKERKFTFSAGVLFDTGKAELKPEAVPSLDSLHQFLEKYPSVVLGISGHTDDVGTDEYNQNLSERRALAVKNYLEIKGVSANRLRAKGFGESRPVADNSTEQGRQANRRVECVVLKQ